MSKAQEAIKRLMNNANPEIWDSINNGDEIHKELLEALQSEVGEVDNKGLFNEVSETLAYYARHGRNLNTFAEMANDTYHKFQAFRDSQALTPAPDVEKLCDDLCHRMHLELPANNKEVVRSALYHLQETGRLK